MNRTPDHADRSRRQPKLMDFSKIRDIFESHYEEIREQLFFNHELGILHGNAKMFRLMVQQQPPFAIDDHRLGILMRGEIRININLVERTLRPGTIVYLGPGSIINPIHVPEDLEIFGLVLFSNFPMPFAAGNFPAAFNGQVRDFQLEVSEEEAGIALSIIETLRQLVRHRDYNRLSAVSLVAALMHHYDGVYRSHLESQQAMLSREQTIFDRFLQLVNQHATREHQMAFYASKMCLTERYLGTVVRQASGVTAKEWIDRALIARIKVELRHTDKSVARISEELCFPNPSFFSKYFKRLTQMTPAEYRES